MTLFENEVGRETFERIQAEAKTLTLGEKLVIRNCMAGKVTYDDLPPNIRERLARIGSASIAGSPLDSASKAKP